MLESAVQGALRLGVRKLGGRMMKIDSASNTGVPDVLVALPVGRLFLVELKQVKGERSAKQIWWHSELAKIGVEVATLHGTEQVREWLRDVQG